MRATREIELLQSFPIHEVANWLGHYPTVAMQHYAQVSKEQEGDGRSLLALKASLDLSSDQEAPRAPCGI